MIPWFIVVFIIGWISGVCTGIAMAHVYLSKKFGG